jgi:peroxiredoxin
LTDYREHYLEIPSAGASVVAVSVDAPNKSEALRIDLSLPFPILCDTERFRTYRVLELALFHSLGKLPEPESTHDFF